MKKMSILNKYTFGFVVLFALLAGSLVTVLAVYPAGFWQITQVNEKYELQYGDGAINNTVFRAFEDDRVGVNKLCNINGGSCVSTERVIPFLSLDLNNTIPSSPGPYLFVDDTQNPPVLKVWNAQGLTSGFVTLSTGAAPLDSDNDGLSDDDEINVHGTDPNDIDSDDDGLSDYDEVNVHGTDPNDADSDNDGKSDYDEITDGDDPNVDDQACSTENYTTNGYTFVSGNLNVGQSVSVSTSKAIANGTLAASITATCSGGSISWTNFSQASTASCDPGYTPSGASCVILNHFPSPF